MNKKVIQYFILFLSLAYHQEHFTLNIDETGESTLFIFQDNITTLTIGDEIGIFDYNGIIDNQGNLGEILVGSGIWDGSQLEIVGIHSVDLSQFGGPILPGAIVGNSFTIKIWNALEQAETNCEGRTPVLVFKRNHSKTYVAIELDSWLKTIKS